MLCLSTGRDNEVATLELTKDFLMELRAKTLKPTRRNLYLNVNFTKMKLYTLFMTEEKKNKMEDQITDPKKHIETIYGRYFSADRSILKGFASTVRLNLQNFPSTGHFIIEMLQNSDDAGSTTFELKATDELVEIINNGKPFSYSNVESICNSAVSNKNPEYDLGYLGVGFKACFKISTKVEIYSGEYSFKFDQKEVGNTNLPFELMPIWVENSISRADGARFRLFLGSDIRIRQLIAQQLESASISGKMMLFLHKLSEINIQAEIGGKIIQRKLKRNLTAESEEFETFEISEEKQTDSIISRWVVFKKTYIVPEELKDDELTRQFRRDNISKRDVFAAFEIDEEGEIKTGHGSIHLGVYSFLPLRDIESTLKFIIQGDFLTNPGRSDILREASWNSWTADCVFDLLTTKCIPIFLQRKGWKYHVSDVFYAETLANELVNERIIIPLRRFLQENPVVFDVEDKPILPTEAIRLPEDVIKLIGQDKVSNIFGKALIHPSVEYPSRLEGIQDGPESITDFLDTSEAKALLQRQAITRDLKWFKSFYKKLDSLINDKDELQMLGKKKWLLSEAYEPLSPSELRIAKDQSIPESKLSEFKIVNRGLLDELVILNFLQNKVGLRMLTMDDIRDLNQYTPEEWRNLNDKEKIGFIRYLKSNPSKITAPLSYLTIPTKGGVWEKPDKLVFPKEYMPNYDIENLVQKGLLSARVPMFVSPSLMGNQAENSVEWREVLSKLGCDDETLLKDIKEEAGIRAVRLYESEVEHRQVKDPREMGLNQFPGYDLKSTGSDGEARLIEVKSSEKIYGFDLAISVNEHKALYEDRPTNEKNYIYAVKNVLKFPEINILEGTDIKKLTTKLFVNETGKDGWGKIKKKSVNILSMIDIIGDSS